MTAADTAEALVDAAEGLFAESGFEAASLRAVMRAAGSDPGSIHYHFRGREGLSAAVLRRVLVPLNQRRLELLNAAEQAADPIPLHWIIDAIVRPDIELAQELHHRGPGRARLLGAVYINPASFVKGNVEHHFAPVAARFMPHLVRAVPEVAPELLAWRVRWCVFGVVGAVLSDGDEALALDPEELVDRLVTATSAAVDAAVHGAGEPLGRFGRIDQPVAPAAGKEP
ncbi:MAG: TetR/AcrR family transcriptional regulator [Acidimicrobiales bacterium]